MHDSEHLEEQLELTHSEKQASQALTDGVALLPAGAGAGAVSGPSLISS